MTRRIIDLSVAIENGVPADPPPLMPNIEYLDHAAGAAEFEAMFGIPVEKQIEGAGPASERVHMTTHNGTHLDAPWHYHPTMNGGERAMTIDEVPLEWCIGPGVKLDFRALPDGHVVTADEVQAELQRIGHSLQAGDIVLVNTRAGARYGQPDFLAAGCGIGREATLWLAGQGVRVCGTDAWSWDPPLAGQAAHAKETGDYSLFWEGHKAGADCVYCHIEKLTNLDQLPHSGFEVMALPVKVANASAGWCRAVAVFHD
ncbi:cyclase family protein [Yoonia sp. R78084]|uniref:cyclase family protein n=1 Tax=Yoonia sp. R78084 TaxID=3093869 RepID=UPI0037DD1D64